MDFCRKQVKSDTEELLERFRLTQSVRFDDFSDIWREMKFSHIFYGTKQYEKRLFSRMVLDSASSFFFPPFSFQIRVGGLYLLYSLYKCQTASPPEQIRLALKDWDEVKKFERDAVDAQHFDVVYILQQLMSCKGFNFTAMPNLLFYDRKKKVERSVLCEQFMERASRPQELINVGLLEEMSNVQNIYENMKTSVISQMTAGEDFSVNIVRKDLVSRLRSTVLDYYMWQKKDSVDAEGESSEGTSSQQECSKRADLLASIKSKAFGEAPEASKSRRHRQVELDTSATGAERATMSGYTRISIQSLKARTNESVHISDDLWKDNTTTTQIERLTRLESEESPKKFKRFKR
ncbi:snRNA-activating protein complex subunit 1b [Menidia menidia]|uniref:(Atlantic silverside) hypothetical protein n=1 Tax=Menidia menidia TaxID=238744 RepID=A0A8S4AIT8_9TELE|nr:unnamed protein product [Menidia menidia]